MGDQQLAEERFLVIAYILVFLYIYFVVGKFELVKSNFGLGVAAVIIVFGSMAMAVLLCASITGLPLCLQIGICKFFGLVTTLAAVEVVPFLVVAIGNAQWHGLIFDIV